MKKLLITSMAAVAVSICAKAEFTANESFEEYTNEGPLFPVAEDTGKYIYGEDWTSEATPEDGIFTVTNISKITSVGDSYPTDRPLDGDNANALAIDTEKSLIRRVIPGASSTDLEGASLEGGPIFFDSVVQFTATETAPETTDAKLVAWLYKTEDLADGEKGLFGETDPISKLVVTALYDTDDGLFETNYLTDVTIQPESWHRLTIKSFVQGDLLQFEVRVDGDIVKVNGEQVPFISLDEKGTRDQTLKGVAFEGKGVVDDLVFTTTDPFAVASYVVTTSLSEEADVEGAVRSAEYKLDSGEYNELALSGTLTLPVTTTDFTAKLWISDGAKLVGGTKKADEVDADGNYAWYISYDAATFKKDGTDSIVFEVIVDDGTEDPITKYAVSVVANALEATVGGLSAEYAEGNVVTFTVAAATGYTIESVAVAGATTAPTLMVNGDGYSFTMPAEAVTITVTTKAEEVTYPSVGGVDAPEYSNTAKAKIDAAFPGNSYPADGLTVKVNGVTLSGAPAVAMLNEAVEMFTLAGDAKFFDADGVLDISFKATGADPDVVAYEAKVGGLAATVNESSYEVVPKYIDIATNAELQAKPEEGTVTFRLVIQKK